MKITNKPIEMKKSFCLILCMCTLCLATLREHPLSAASIPQKTDSARTPKVITLAFNIIPVPGHKSLQYEKSPYRMHISDLDTGKVKQVNDTIQLIHSYNHDITKGIWICLRRPVGKEFKTTIEHFGDFTNEYFLGIVQNVSPKN